MMDEEFTVEDKEHELDQVQKHAHDRIRGATEQEIKDAVAAGS